jgi:hypothetical protein
MRRRARPEGAREEQELKVGYRERTPSHAQRGQVFPNVPLSFPRAPGQATNHGRNARFAGCPPAVVGFDNCPSLPMDMGVRRWALTSDSTLRFRERAEVETSLVEHG